MIARLSFDLGGGHAILYRLNDMAIAKNILSSAFLPPLLSIAT
jgi:hypothetical protein